jgi:hypothetical protein
MATAAGMMMVPFAVEAGCAFMDNKDPKVGDTMTGIVGTLFVALVPAAIISGLVYSVANK